MKKILMLLFVVFILISLLKLEDVLTNKEKEGGALMKEEIRGVYVSYIELSKYLDGKNEEEGKQIISSMIEKMKNDKFNWIFLHVRAFSDSLYPSDIYPTHYLVYGNEEEELSFDILQHFISTAHEKGMQVHAWINPFRVRNSGATENISVKNPAFSYLGTSHVKLIPGKGIYYNPASEEVQQLILSGIDEILTRYSVDGIHFDDYFYPDDTIDLENYEAYQKSGGNLSLKEYRLQVVNEFIKKVYTLVKSKNPKVLFGIAPEGNMENNYEKNYADVLTWMQEEGYVDYIMPQLYYGFQNSAKPYAIVLNEWSEKVTNDKVFLLPALAFYKTGEVDTYAGLGSTEWQEFENVIANQIRFLRQLPNVSGFSLFRYGSLYEDKGTVREAEYQNLKKIL